MKQERKNNFFEESERNEKYFLLHEYYTSDFYSIFQPSFRLKFDTMNLYLEKSQNMINEIPSELKAKIEAWDRNPPIPEPPPDTPPEMRWQVPDGIDQYFDEVIIPLEKYSSILYNSTFISVFSWFESEFFELCDYCKGEEKLKEGAEDMRAKKGGDIGKCRKFITKLLDVNLDSLNNEWKEIMVYKDIRNSIVHERGQIANPLVEGKYVIDFINETDGIKFTGRVEIESIDFIKNFNKSVFDYLIGVCSEILKQKN